MVSRQPEALAPHYPAANGDVGFDGVTENSLPAPVATQLYGNFGQSSNFPQPWLTAQKPEVPTPTAQPSHEQPEPVSLLKGPAATPAAQTSGHVKPAPSRQQAIARSEKVFLDQPRQVGKYAGIVVLRQKINVNGRRHWYGLDAQGNRHHLSHDAILESFMGADVRPQGRRPKAVAITPGTAVKQEITALTDERDGSADSVEARLKDAHERRETLHEQRAAAEAAPDRSYDTSQNFSKQLIASLDIKKTRSRRRQWREILTGHRRRLAAGLALAGIVLGAAVFASEGDNHAVRQSGRTPAVSQPSQRPDNQPVTPVSPTPSKPTPTSVPITPEASQPAPKLPASPKLGKHRSNGSQHGKTGHVARHGHNAVQAITIRRGSSVWKTMEAITIDGKHIPRNKLWAASWIEMKANHISKAHEVQTGWRLKIATAKLAKLLSSHRVTNNACLGPAARLY